MFKRIISLVLCAVLAVSMTACSRGNTDNGGKVSLKVWGAQEDQELLKRMIGEFEKENDDIDYDITLGVVGTKDAQAKILEDPAAAADVFVFSDDHFIGPGSDFCYKHRMSHSQIQSFSLSHSIIGNSSMFSQNISF